METVNTMAINNLQTSKLPNLQTPGIEEFLAKDEKKDFLRLCVCES